MLSAGAVILNYNSSKNSIRLASLLKTFQSLKKVIIVDNASTDDSITWLNQFKSSKIKIILNEKNFGYNAGNNIGLKELVEKDNLEICFIINPDVLLSEETIIEVLKIFEHHEEYAVLSTIHDGPGVLQEWQWFDPKNWSVNILDAFVITRFIQRKIRGKSLGQEKTLEEARALQNLSEVYGVMGAFLGIRSDVLKEIDYFDEDVFLYWEEIILAEQIKALRKKIGLLNQVKFEHLHDYSKSSRLKKLQTNLILYHSAQIVIKKYAPLSAAQRGFWKFSTNVKIFEVKFAIIIFKIGKMVEGIK